MTHFRGGPTRVGSGVPLSDRRCYAEEEETANLANPANLLRSSRAAWEEEFSRKKAQARRKGKVGETKDI